MRDELNDAARRGFVFVAQTVFVTTFGGNEVVVIMERSPHSDAPICEYELLATTRTSTMQDELSEYSRKGFLVRGLSVSETVNPKRRIRFQRRRVHTQCLAIYHPTRR